MITFREYLLEEESKKLAQEREERKIAGVESDLPTGYLQVGHDAPNRPDVVSPWSLDFDDEVNKENADRTRAILAKVYGIHAGKEKRLPDLWASGPTIKTKEGEGLVSVRPMDQLGDIHTDVFPDAYEKTSDENNKLVIRSRPHPHLYGRIDHVRRVISMSGHQPKTFSNRYIDKLYSELKNRYPEYEIHDTIEK